jgi:hypothetical protein
MVGDCVWTLESALPDRPIQLAVNGGLPCPGGLGAPVNGVHPQHGFGLFHRLNVQVDRGGLTVAAHQHTLQHFRGAGVDLLVRHIGRHVDEIARAGFGGELQALAPAHAGTALDHVDHALQGPMVVGTGFGVGVDVHRAGPELLRAHPRKVDGSLAVHARRLSGVGVQLIARHHAHTIVLPSRCARVGVVAVGVMVIGHGKRWDQVLGT